MVGPISERPCCELRTARLHLAYKLLLWVIIIVTRFVSPTAGLGAMASARSYKGLDENRAV
jgi:hypothetical protein